MNFIRNFHAFAITNRIATLGIFLALILILYAVFHSPAASAQTRYILGTVEKGTLTVAVSASGQIEASDQIDVKPKASAEVYSVLVAPGQTVQAGQVLAYLNTTDAQQAVKNASVALENAKIALQKLERNQVVDSTNSTTDLEEAYDSAMNTVSNAFLKLPDLVDTARGVLYDDTLKGGCSPNSCQYTNLVSDDVDLELLGAIARAEDDYQEARDRYDETFAEYRVLRYDAPADEIITILEKTKQTADLLAQTVKSEQNVLDMLVDDMKNQAIKNNVTANIPSQITTYQGDLGSALSSLNSISSQVNSIRKNIQSTQQNIDDAVFTDPIDLAAQQNTVAQRESDLLEAQRQLAYHVVRSPITGVVSAVNVKKGDNASSGTTVATVVSSEQIAIVSLNEVDIANVSVGQKVTLTFDALEDLTVTGRVTYVDAVGTANQGVVNYDVTIALDTQDEHVRPGMSLSANIVTGVVQDALLVPSSAVKTQGDIAYIETFENTTDEQLASVAGFVSRQAPQQIQVELGASNDTMTQIVSGAEEGDVIISRTISGSSSATTTTSQRSIFQGGGGEIRAFTR